jgi:UV DNA damage repair endonuclease
MDRIGCAASYESPINLHVQNKEGTNQEVFSRFLSNFNKLDANCKSRLVLENDDKVNCWSVRELVEVFHSGLGIPITFDYHHFNINPGTLSLAKALEITSASWPNNDPVQHYSEGRTKPLDTAHSDYVKSLPDQPWDIEVEAKQKDLSIKPFISTRNKLIEGIIY